MALRQDSQAAAAATPPEKPRLTDLLPNFSIKERLEKLKKKLPKKSELYRMTAKLLANFNSMDSTERKKEIARILQLSALVWLLSDEEREEEAAVEEAAQPGYTPPPEEEEEMAEEDDTEEEEKEDETEARERRRKVVCDNVRLIVINTDPAGSRRPAHLKLKPKYLCEYGLPEYDTFKEEMLSILAPDIKNEKEAMKKVISVLQRSPMGKYQCMPQYLFKYVKKFKKFKWFKEWEGRQLEEKLHAMWEFLQDEKLQREACRGYIQGVVSALNQEPGFNNDPRYVRAAYYGGLSAGKALLARDLGTATEAQQRRVAKKQGDYISIDSYSGEAEKQGGQLKQFGAVDIEAVVSSIASRESAAYEGQKSRPRDEEWERDKRYAYNRSGEDEGEVAEEDEESEEDESPEEFDKKKFRKGKLFPAIKRHFEYARVTPTLFKMETISIKVHGEPGWNYENSSETTDNWDWESAGNTEEDIDKGTYRSESVIAPPGYSRKKEDIEEAPEKTRKKIERICVALKRDPRMPLFTGITMTVDGHSILVVKEIHTWSKGKGSKGLCQPHTGTAFMVRKGERERLPSPAGTTPVANSELTLGIKQAAAEALAQMSGKPIGSETRGTAEGVTYVFQKQTHYNRNIYGAPGVGAFRAA